jgi:hypothetical protein
MCPVRLAGGKSAWAVLPRSPDELVPARRLTGHHLDHQQAVSTWKDLLSSTGGSAPRTSRRRRRRLSNSRDVRPRSALRAVPRADPARERVHRAGPLHELTSTSDGLNSPHPPATGSDGFDRVPPVATRGTENWPLPAAMARRAAFALVLELLVRQIIVLSVRSRVRAHPPHLCDVAGHRAQVSRDIVHGRAWGW